MLRIPCENDGRLLYDKQFLKLPLKTKQTKRKEKKSIFKSAHMFFKRYQILTDWEMNSRAEVPQVSMDPLD